MLLTRLVNDVGDNPDQLSILQHALNRTWARWQNEGGGKGPLDLAHYEAIGTMAHALDQHAEQAYAELGATRQQQICEKLFKALTDKATDPRGVRRPTTLGELRVLTDATAVEVAEVIAVFRDPSRSFLMPPAGEALEAETVIDISHESLMRVWQRLIKWADEEAQSARIYRRLADTADLHAAGNASLWRDPELQLALDWREKNQPNETWASRYHPGFAAATRFLTESSAAREAERAERQQQRQREREAQQEKAEAQARYARRMRRAAFISSALAGVAVVFCLVAVGFGVWAYKASNIAEANKEEAQTYLYETQITQSRSLVSAAEKDPSDQSTRILLALEALPDVKEKIERPVVFEAQESVIEGINNLRELAVVSAHTGAVWAVAVSRDGARIVTGSGDKTARVWDAQTETELLQLKGHTDGVWAAAVTPDGARVVTGSRDKTARVWDARTGDELLQLNGHTNWVLAVAVTPDGARIVTGSADNTARVWDARTGAELLQLKGHTGFVNGVAVTPDGARIVTGSADKTVRVWDAHTGDELLQLKGHAATILAVAVTPNGGRIVTGSDDNTARVWDMAQLRPPPAQHQVFSIQTRQALVDHAKAAVPRCLTIEQRKTFLLTPMPPHWCIEMRKYPYNVNPWTTDDPRDPDVAGAFGNFANDALIAGDFRKALEAADLGIWFHKEEIWIRINRAHALMFLGQTEKARDEYLTWVGTKLPEANDHLWENEVVEDFSRLRKKGREHPLMIEIEQKLVKPSLPVQAGE